MIPRSVSYVSERVSGINPVYTSPGPPPLEDEGRGEGVYNDAQRRDGMAERRIRGIVPLRPKVALRSTRLLLWLLALERLHLLADPDVAELDGIAVKLDQNRQLGRVLGVARRVRIG